MFPVCVCAWSSREVVWLRPTIQKIADRVKLIGSSKLPVGVDVSVSSPVINW